MSVPFWNSDIQAISPKVWRPTKAETASVERVHFPPAFAKLTKNTWFTTTLSRPSSASSSFTDEWKVSAAHSLASVSSSSSSTVKKRKAPATPKRGASTAKKKKPPELQAAKMMKVAVHPTTQQKDVLRQWIGTCRWTYNQCVSQGKEHPATSDIKTLRSLFVNNDTMKEKGLDWALKVPYDVRSEAARDYIKAVESNKAKKKLTPKHHFEIKFRSRKRCHQETINLLGKHAHWKPESPDCESLFSSAFFPGVLHLAETLPFHLFKGDGTRSGRPCLYDLRLIREKTGDWFLCIPLPLTHVYPDTLPLSVYRDAASNEVAARKIVALDPGVRTFMTGYSPDGYLLEIGPGDSRKLQTVAEKVDVLQSRWVRSNNTKAKKRRRMKRKAAKLRRRAKNLVDEVHRKTTKLLVAEFDTILIPTFEVSQMVERDDRNISTKTVRQMLNWRHYAFRQLLHAKSREVPGVKVIEVTEEYTSKTCGGCGIINHTLGASKCFKCPHCHLELDRDANGARNIFLKNMDLCRTGG